MIPLKIQESPTMKTCLWERGWDYWKAGCGRCLFDGISGARKYDFVYCPYCGGRLTTNEPTLGAEDGSGTEEETLARKHEHSREFSGMGIGEWDDLSTW